MSITSIIQKRIHALTDLFTPSASDDFTNIYFAVDSPAWIRARKLKASTIFSSVVHTESSIKTFTGTTYSLTYTDVGGTPFNNNDYRLTLNVWTIETIDGKTYRQYEQSLLNLTQTPTGFSFEVYENSGTMYVDYYATTR